MRRAIITLLIITLHYTVAAQAIEGTVVDKELKIAIPGITVINRHTGVIAFSDSNGYYKIAAAAGDTIQFRHTAYEPVWEVMVYSMGTRFKSIQMLPLVYRLKEQTITVLTKYQQDSLERHELFNHELTKTVIAKPRYTGLGCSGCIGWLADKITGNSKRPKRFRKNFGSEDEEKFIDTRYTPELVTMLTGITKEDSVAAFIYTHPMNYDFARTASDLELKAWIRYAYKEAKKSDTLTKP